MAEENNSAFKTTLMGGYNKDDVQKQIKTIRDEAAAEKNKLLLVLKGREKKIAELKEKIADRDAEIDNLKKDINVKYKSYVDNYEMIGQLVLDSKLRAKQVIDAAYAERDKILAEARNSAEAQLKEKKRDLELLIEEETRKYEAIQEEVNELIELVNRVQRKFLNSFKAIQELEGSSMRKSAASEDYEDYSIKGDIPVWDWADEEAAAVKKESKGEDITGDLYDFLEEEIPNEGEDLDEPDTREYDDDFIRLTAEALALDDPDEA